MSGYFGDTTLVTCLNRGAHLNAIGAYKRGPLFAAVELHNFNHEKYPDLPRARSAGSDQALLAKGANPNQQTNTNACAWFDAIRWLVGEFRWADAVDSSSAFGRWRGDEDPAPVQSQWRKLWESAKKAVELMEACIIQRRS